MTCDQSNPYARTSKIIVLMIAICGLVFGIVGAWSCRFAYIDEAIACAALGILATIIELLCCKFVASCAFSAILFLAACFLEISALVTFIQSIVKGDFHVSVACTINGQTGNCTTTSIVCYFLAGCMLCCIPQPDVVQDKR